MSMYVRYTQPKGLKAQFEIIHYGEGQIHMKCPICGQELRPGKKDPNYLLCYNCKKKFKIPQSAHKVQKRAEKPEPEEQKYSNIPPKEVREKREQEMRDAYDELLAVGDGRKKKKDVKSTNHYSCNCYHRSSWINCIHAAEIIN